MAIRPILLHPDPRLKRRCAPVTAFDAGLATLVEDMFATMYDAPGIGLAAPQIGVETRVLVMDCALRDGAEEQAPLALINPVIEAASDELSEYDEGCLSIPDIFGRVTRPARVRVAFQDPAGAAQVREFAGIWATCVQHEIDHLDGRLFIDHLGPITRMRITERMRKFKRERARAAAQG